MPERSFGRTIRYRRTKLGLSQAKLGELVGRSATTIRSWERDTSTPTDARVLFALAAVLDLDARHLFEKAGVEVPPHEEKPTVEQALASLRPTVEAALPTTAEPVGKDDEPAEADVDWELEAELGESPAGEDREPEPGFEPFPLLPEPEEVPTPMKTLSPPAFLVPPEPFQVSAPSPPPMEPSYVEDAAQRQLYRVRNLATLVIVVALIVVFIWSLNNAFDAFGAWWDSFISALRL